MRLRQQGDQTKKSILKHGCSTRLGTSTSHVELYSIRFDYILFHYNILYNIVLSEHFTKTSSPAHSRMVSMGLRGDVARRTNSLASFLQARHALFQLRVTPSRQARFTKLQTSRASRATCQEGPSASVTYETPRAPLQSSLSLAVQARPKSASIGLPPAGSGFYTILAVDKVILGIHARNLNKGASVCDNSGIHKHRDHTAHKGNSNNNNNSKKHFRQKQP